MWYVALTLAEVAAATLLASTSAASSAASGAVVEYKEQVRPVVGWQWQFEAVSDGGELLFSFGLVSLVSSRNRNRTVRSTSRTRPKPNVYRTKAIEEKYLRPATSGDSLAAVAVAAEKPEEFLALTHAVYRNEL